MPSHADFEELLPFYAAGTLPADTASRLERHLMACNRCQQELAEWQAIGNAVRREAARWSASLPPLTIRPYSGVTTRRENTPYPSDYAAQTVPMRLWRSEPSAPAARRRFPLGAALAAAAAIVIVVGAALFAGRGNGTYSGSVAGGETLIANDSTQIAAAPSLTTTGDPLTMKQPDTTPTLFIPTLDATQNAAITPIIVVPPQVTSGPIIVPSQPPAPTAPFIPPVLTPTPVVPMAVPTQMPPTEQSFSIQSTPAFDSSPQATSDESRLIPPGVGGGSDEVCRVTNPQGDSVRLYNLPLPLPNPRMEIVGYLQSGESSTVIARHRNEIGIFYLVQVERPNEQAFFGWVYEGDISVSGPCDEVPLLDTFDPPPSVTSAPLP